MTHEQLRSRRGHLVATVTAMIAMLSVVLFGATSVRAMPTGADADTSVDSAAGTMVFVFSIVAVLVIAGIIVWKAQKNRPR